MGSGHSSKNESFDGSGIVNFDHFQILRAIGKGSFGKVCIVQKKDTKKMFAMKYMNKASCAKQDAVNNVIREVDILTKVDHAFLVNVWYCFQDEEDMFVVVDLLLGGDLRYHMQTDVNFTEKHVQLYLAELALALEYLRERCILHRDIKPDNILLDEEGHVHITDFNIATQLKKGEQATSITGTKPYMAPEMFSTALGERRGYGYTIDWWALGVTIFELLKKRRPFNIHGDTCAREIWHTLYSTKVHFPSHVSDEMNDLLRQLLHVDPQQRVQTVQAIQAHPSMADLDFEKVKVKNIKPLFVPSKDHLNCDPTYELEEMIIETKPLHKKKKRLAKQNSKKDSITSDSMCRTPDTTPDLFKDFLYYDREQHVNGHLPSSAVDMDSQDRDPSQPESPQALDDEQSNSQSPSSPDALKASTEEDIHGTSTS